MRVSRDCMFFLVFPFHQPLRCWQAAHLATALCRRVLGEQNELKTKPNERWGKTRKGKKLNQARLNGHLSARSCVRPSNLLDACFLPQTASAVSVQFLFACMCACMHVCMCVCMHACMSLNGHATVAAHHTRKVAQW